MFFSSKTQTWIECICKMFNGPQTLRSPGGGNRATSSTSGQSPTLTKRLSSGRHFPENKTAIACVTLNLLLFLNLQCMYSVILSSPGNQPWQEWPIFLFLVRLWPLLAAVIITAAKEEVRWRSIENGKRSYREEVRDGCLRVRGWCPMRRQSQWLYHNQNFNVFLKLTK